MRKNIFINIGDLRYTFNDDAVLSFSIFLNLSVNPTCSLSRPVSLNTFELLIKRFLSSIKWKSMAQRHSPHKVSTILKQQHFTANATQMVSKMSRSATEKVRLDRFYEIHIHISFVREQDGES